MEGPCPTMIASGPPDALILGPDDSPCLVYETEMPTNALRELRVLASLALPLVIAQLGIADFVVCANERQTDYWLGTLMAVGKIGAQSARVDPSCRHLVAAVPFGVPNTAELSAPAWSHGSFQTTACQYSRR